MSDFATHLRTVHFTLILACVITIVSLIGGVETEVERAHRQLHKVTRIKSEWDTWLPRWAGEEARALEASGINQWTKVPSSIHVCIPNVRNWQFPLQGAPLQFSFSIQGKGERVFADAVRKVDGTLRFYSRVEQWPGTLDDFKVFWNSVNKIYVRIVERVEPNLYLVHADGNMDSYRWTNPCAASASSLDLQYRGDAKACSERVSQKWAGPLFCGESSHEKITVAVPVVVREERVLSNLRSWLADNYKLQAAGVGFEKDFAALNKVTAHYALLPFNNAQLILEGELQRSGERIQLVGLNLPLITLAVTTVGIIVAIQFYFWLHLRQFQPSGKDAEVAWVGLYDNLFARAITLGTGLGLPLGTLIFVMIDRRSWWILLPVIVSLVIAFFSFPLLWKLPYVPIRSCWAFSVIWKDFWRCTAIAWRTRFTSRQHRPKK
jgi:hypothetical protein